MPQSWTRASKAKELKSVSPPRLSIRKHLPGRIVLAVSQHSIQPAELVALAALRASGRACAQNLWEAADQVSKADVVSRCRASCRTSGSGTAKIS